ncbi:ABC transporter ATP-binding protein [Ferviditalea candida]|uniref:ABC transporter ATP-binding protein n=1 Tax=Ferviditalea candida TaxID=3108399 RepID=A0ABU5ZID3_9BACL|nr:ABC transporter ATP-binding protein [Paenibacillaceae bacterium T2]
MLKLNQVETLYGEIVALKNVTIEVNEGETVVLLGSNGAGKTTTLRTISQLLRPSKGSITFHGENMNEMSPEEVVKKRIIHVPEGRKIFPGLTVRENLVLGASNRKVTKKEMNRLIDEVLAVFPDLERLIDQLGWSLSGGQQQMCAIGRGLMASPRLLMLDEPSLGLAPVIVQNVFQKIKQINREQGVTVLLVEQNARQSLSIAHRGYILETGRVVLQDNARALLNDEKVQEAYLGSSKLIKQANG